MPEPTVRQPERKGLFVVFEGGDGAGKSSQIPELAAWLTSLGHDVLATREPGGTEIGENIRPLILEQGHGDVDARTEALLYAAARAAHVEQVILPRLRDGGSVNSLATQGLVPDLTVLLDISPEEGRARRSASRPGEDRIESEPDGFHARTRQAFLDLAAASPERYEVIDARLSKREVQERVQARVAALLEERGEQGARP